MVHQRGEATGAAPKLSGIAMTPTATTTTYRRLTDASLPPLHASSSSVCNQQTDRNPLQLELRSSQKGDRHVGEVGIVRMPIVSVSAVPCVNSCWWGGHGGFFRRGCPPTS